MRQMIFLISAAALTLGACGARNDLRRTDGKAPPPPVAGGPPTTTTLTPPPEAAPERVDDPVKRSRERGDDPFDLPPTN